MKIRLIAAVIVAVMLSPVLSAAEDVVLIGNPSIPESTLTKYEVNNIFLGKKIAWADQTKIIFAIQETSDVHKAFCKAYLNKSPSHFSNYWKKKLFSGKGLQPKVLSGDQEMIEFVSVTKGAVGYVSSNTPLDKVKTIRIK